MNDFDFEDFLDLEFDIRHEMSVFEDKVEENKRKMKEFNKIMQEIEEIDTKSINFFI